jgi:hypothetical protein
MAWVACIHGRTVGLRFAVEDGAKPECSDCEELAALKKLEANARHRARLTIACWTDMPVLRELDAVRARREPAPTGVCTCKFEPLSLAARLTLGFAEGGERIVDLDCPTHGEAAGRFVNAARDA